MREWLPEYTGILPRTNGARITGLIPKAPPKLITGPCAEIKKHVHIEVLISGEECR